jgi:hypothetical protein
MPTDFLSGLLTHSLYCIVSFVPARLIAVRLKIWSLTKGYNYVGINIHRWNVLILGVFLHGLSAVGFAHLSNGMISHLELWVDSNIENYGNID